MNQRQQKQKAFTVIELLIALLLGSLVFVGAIHAFRYVAESFDLASDNMKEAIQAKAGSVMMVRDFQRSSVSANLLAQADECGNNLFDYLPNNSACYAPLNPRSIYDFAMENKCAEFARCGRRLRLTPNSQISTQSSLLLLTDLLGGIAHPVSFTPSKLFGSPSHQNADLEFKPKELKRIMKMAKQAFDQPDIWMDDELILFETVGWFEDATDPANRRKRKIFFLGVMTKDGEVEAINDPYLLNQLELSHSALRNPASSLEAFLRNLPMDAGLAPLVFARPVRLLRYHVQPKNDIEQGTAALMREVWIPKTRKFGPKMTMAYPIKDLMVVRSDIGSNTINFKVTPMNNRKQKAEGGPNENSN